MGVLQAKVFAQLLFPKVRYIARVFNLVYYVFCWELQSTPYSYVLQAQTSMLVINVVMIRIKQLKLR